MTRIKARATGNGLGCGVAAELGAFLQGRASAPGVQRCGTPHDPFIVWGSLISEAEVTGARFLVPAPYDWSVRFLRRANSAVHDQILAHYRRAWPGLAVTSVHWTPQHRANRLPDLYARDGFDPAGSIATNGDGFEPPSKHNRRLSQAVRP